MAHAETRQHAHELIERMAPGQVSAAVELLEKMLDPVSLALANAPFEDEEISEEENGPSPVPRLRLDHLPRWMTC